MQLTGNSPLGVISLTAGSALGLPGSFGQIEEQKNIKPGRLDLPGGDVPFCVPPTPADCAGAQANSFFDVFFEVNVPGVGKLHNAEALRIQSVIDRKPPKTRYVHVITKPIELLDAKGNRTGIFLVSAEHNTNPIEVDQFEKTSALVGLRMPSGQLVNVVLNGPATVDVQLGSLKDQRSLGAPGPNGLEEVNTELVQMQLTGNSPLGAVTLFAGSALGLPGSYGQIEEKQNIQAGRLDLPGPDAPFCTPPTPANCVGAQANSFFDVFFEVSVPNVGKLHNKDPLRIQAMIDQKPPKSSYIHVITDPIELFDANNKPTGIFLVSAEHNTTPFEIDRFDTTQALVGLRMPNNQLVNVILSGPATVQVNLGSLKDQKSVGAPGSNGLEEVDTELVQMQLTGNSAAGAVTLHAGRMLGLPASNGQIEEKQNIKSGRLDLPGPDAPFCTPPTPADCAGAQANSFFDVFFEVSVPNVGKLHNKDPLRIQAMIDQKPPKARYIHVITNPIELYDANGKPTGIFLVTAEHDTTPVEVDSFPRTVAGIVLNTPKGNEFVQLRGPSKIIAFIDDKTGAASDTDGNKLDQVKTEMVDLTLKGYSSLGPVVVHLDPNRLSTGQIEEANNKTPGKLDVPPFTPEGTADSFFDIFFDITVGEQTFHNGEPLRIQTTITHKPPAQQDFYLSPVGRSVTLLDANGKPTEIKLMRAINIPVPPIRVISNVRTTAQLVLQKPNGRETINFNGHATANVFTTQTGKAVDIDGDGLDQVMTEMTSLELRGQSSFGPVILRLRRAFSSTGEIVEGKNLTPGVLDVRPFTPGGTAKGFFDVFVEIELPQPAAAGQASPSANVILHTGASLQLQTTLSSDDPLTGQTYLAMITTPVDLLDESDNASGFALVGQVQVSSPLNIYLPSIQRPN